MSNQVSFNRRRQLLRVSAILGVVLFCVVALLQMPSALPFSANLTEAKEEPTNHAEATATLVSLPIKHIITTSFITVNDIDVADVDGDGKLDIIGGSLNDKGFTWWKKNEDGKGSGWTAYTVNEESGYTGTVSLQAADIDNDDDYDVVAAVDFTEKVQRIVWWENEGTPTSPKWREHKVILTETLKIDIADMDKDNDMDILSVANNGNIILLENPSDNDVTWEPHIIATLDEFKTSAPSIYAVDINGDSYIDILAGSNFAGSNKAGIRWWQNKNGTLPNETTPWPTYVVNENINVTSIYTAYIDDDDDLDIIDICCSANNRAIRWWLNSGAKKDWGEPHLVAQFNGGRDVHAADLDQDDHMDILAVGTLGVAWWENDGTGHNGTPWPKATVDSSFKSAKIVTAADINGDGYPDIVAAGGSTIAWWQFVPDPPLLNSIDNEDGDYQVTWSTDQEVITYTLQEADNSSFSSFITYITDTQSYPITGKEPGTYYYRVRAENEIGQSLWSTRATAIVLSPPRMLYLPIVLKAPPPTPTTTPTTTPTITLTPTPETPSPTPETPSPTPETPSPTPTCITTEVEANNNPQQATTSNNSPCKGQSVTGSHPLDDEDPHGEDYYEIMIDGQGTQNIRVDLDNIPSGKDYNIQIKDMNDQPVGSCFSGQSKPPNAPEQINCPVNAPNTYYIRVYYGSGGSSTQTYRLKWEVVSP